MKKYLIAILTLTLAACQTNKTATDATDENDTAPVSFNADSAFVLIEKQCAFGARTPNSAAHDSCARFIVENFKACGLTVSEQKTSVRGWDGKSLACNNITASYRPEATKRIVIATHWESRPWADQDADSTNWRKSVLAANDGASGVAVMLEVARLLKDLNPAVGIDFVCFDAEDYGAPAWGKSSDDGSDWCLGSAYWSTHLPADYHPLYGILLDMVGGDDAHFRFEYYSRQYAEAVLAKVWGAAATAGFDDYFLPEMGGAVNDDHLNMNNLAHIPTIDVIADNGTGFSRTWHTTQDTPENISKETLRAVGQTLLQLIYEETGE